MIGESYSQSLERLIKRILVADVDKKFQDIVEYPVSTGGKRLRPLLVITSCLMLGGKIKDALPVAAGIEILHNYSLIIDDIIDNSNLRRGRPTTWFKFGHSIAECIAAYYSGAVFQAANLTKESSKIIDLFAKTLKRIIDGEILDILFEKEGRIEEPYVVRNRYQNISEKDYLKMVGKKTATLFQACCEAGGIVALAKEREIEALKNYGFNLGLAFQVKDDILDIFGEKTSLDRELGKDIRERKGGNIVVIFALKELPRKKREKVLKIMRKKRIEDKEIREAVNLINQTNSQQRAHLFGQKLVERAKEALNFLPKNKWNNILRELADFVMARGK